MLCFRWGPVLYCGPSACVVWLRPESDGKQQESSFCMSVSFYPHSFSLVVRVWSGGFSEPLFSVACSASGPVRNSLVILGFCSFVVGPQFKTTSLFQSFCNPSFHKDVFLKPHPHQANCPNFHFVLSMPLLRLCQ